MIPIDAEDLWHTTWAHWGWYTVLHPSEGEIDSHETLVRWWPFEDRYLAYL